MTSTSVQQSATFAADEAEVSVLGAMLIDESGAARDRALELLTEQDWPTERHRVLFSAMRSLHNGGAAVDPVTLGDHLAQRELLEGVGGMIYISHLLDAVPTSANVEYHARLVAERAQRRRTRAAVLAGLDDVGNAELTLPEVHARVLRRIEELERSSAPVGQRLVRDEDVELLPKPEFLINSLLTQGGLHVLAGPPGHGKTFLAIDWSYCIATGFRWLAHEVENPGPVVYISAEGHAGLGARVRAWKRARRYAGRRAAVWFIPEPVNFADVGAVARLIAELRALPETPQLVVVDTFARCFVGDENSTEDQAAFIAGTDVVRQKVGAAVLILHHLNAAGERERGSTVLRGAADGMLFVKSEDGKLTISCEKSKDASPFEKMTAELRRDGDSCVITPTDVWEQPTGALAKSERDALEALRSGSIPGGLSASVWKDLAGLPNGTFYRARSSLLTRGYVAAEGTDRRASYVLTEEGAKAITPNSQLTPKHSHGSTPKNYSQSGVSLEDPPSGSNGSGSDVPQAVILELGSDG